MKNSVERVSKVLQASATLVANVVENVDRLIEDLTWDSGKVAAEAQALYAQVLETAQQARVAVRATPRFTRIVTEVARLVVVYRLRGSSDHLHKKSAERLHDLCVELRGPILKVGQFASSRPDLLPAAYVEALSRLQDRVPPLPAAQIRARIEAELGRPVDEIFRAFEDEPIAAASLAQVHGAELRDGTRVAVKVQLPGVEDLIEADLAALRVLAAGLKDIFPQVDLQLMANELSRSVVEELDYEAEASHAEAVARDFSGDAAIVVPRVHRDHSSKRVLVLERIDGARLTEFLDGAGGNQRDQLLSSLARAYAAQVLEHGRFQADAHPGNFLVLPDGRLGLLDFGCVQVLPPATRRAWARLAMAILGRDAAAMAALFADLGFKTKTGDGRALEELADMVVGSFRDGADFATIDARAQVTRAFEILQSNPVVEIPREFVLLGRALAALGGMFLHYKPRVGLFTILMPYLAAAMRE